MIQEFPGVPARLPRPFVPLVFLRPSTRPGGPWGRAELGAGPGASWSADYGRARCPLGRPPPLVLPPPIATPLPSLTPPHLPALASWAQRCVPCSKAARPVSVCAGQLPAGQLRRVSLRQLLLHAHLTHAPPKPPRQPLPHSLSVATITYICCRMHVLLTRNAVATDTLSYHFSPHQRI
jgi:hypothetical protein